MPHKYLFIIFILGACNFGEPTKEANYEKCKNNDQKACYRYGVNLEDEGNSSDALKYYRQSCNEKILPACNNLGAILLNQGNSSFDNNKKEEGVKILNTACDEGSGRACVNLALALTAKFAPDMEKIINLYLKACNILPEGAEGCAGYASIMYYDRGQKDKGIEYAIKSCDNDSLLGCYFAGKMLLESNNRKKAITYLKKSCPNAENFHQTGCNLLTKIGEEGPELYKACLCIFDECKNEKSLSCTKIGDCRTISSKTYKKHTEGGTASLIIDKKKYCHNFSLGIP